MRQHEVKTCAPKCRSHGHALDLISLLTKTNDAHILLSALLQCWNCHKIQDKFGRNLLHMAACCGRRVVLEWLTDMKKAELNLKTSENGWTPMHCASFYGNIDCLVSLIKRGANLNKNDCDHLTAMEALSLDKWSFLGYEADLNDNLDVYSWGSNENYNLGMGHEMKKANAEMVEFFKKQNIAISQIKMSKFHTVFMTKSGEVYSCGFGMDGRLGHQNELTLVSPKQVQALKSEKITQIEACRNNSYFLTCEGVLYSCGTNEFKQLGQLDVAKSLGPKPISGGRRLKGKAVKNFACSRFHVVLVTTSNEVYTFGLNAGQLGHSSDSVSCVAEPRLITHLNEPDIDISVVACSDGSTVCLQPSKNVIHLFSDYKVRKLYYMKEVGACFIKIKVIGGKLDHVAESELKWIKNLADPVTIVGLTEKNALFVWREQENSWKSLAWAKNKNFKIVDFDLSNGGVVFCTLQGSCYRAEFKNKVAKISTSPTSLTSETRTYTPSEILDISRISLVNRCVRVFCDLKANNFFALQYHPNTSMHMYPLEMKSILKNDMKLFLDENLNFKNFHDTELKFRDRIYYVHKFIILSRCPKIFSKKELINIQRIDLDQTVSSKFPNNALEIIINFIYTNECCKEIIKKVLKACRILTEASFAKFLTDFKETFVDKFGFVEYKNSFETNSKLVKEIRINCLESNDDKLESMSQFLLKIFDLKNNKSSLKKKQLKFNRDSHPELHDCVINLNNEQTIECHKCIMVARSDFFRNMLLGSWLESNAAEINLPFDLDLMQIYIDYLYSDEILMDFVHAGANYITSLKSKSEKEIELLLNLYVLSDQLLTDRLKNLCEFKLANLVNLKNVAEIFEFSQEYEAKQLKDFCMEFMSLNLVTLLESKQLENVNADRLAELSDFYKSYFDNVGSRRITPYADGLRPEEIELVPQELVFDQKFVDGTIDENEDSWIKQKKVSVTRSESKKEAEEATSPLESPTVELGQIIDQENTNEDKLKWEKVKKKRSRKTSTKEAESPKTPIGLNQVKKVSPTATVSRVIEEKSQVEDKKEIQDEWPSLINAVDFKIKKELKLSKSKPIIETKTSPQLPKTVKSPSNEKLTESKRDVPVWRTNTASSSSASVHSFMDIINEEMKNVNLVKEVKSSVVTKQEENKNLENFKGWKLSQADSIEKSSFSKIVEMEEKSSQQYNKIKNRHLNSIQLEEKAIEDLKKLYQVDLVTNMTITIEFIDEVDFNECLPPIWKKN